MTNIRVVGDVQTRNFTHTIMYWSYGWRKCICHLVRNVDTSTRDSYQATWPHIPEEVCLHIYLCDNLKSR